jgi:hypothetical protein
VPEKGTVTPFEKVTTPSKACPATALTDSVELSGKMRFMAELAEPAGPMVQLADELADDWGKK